MRSRKGRRLGLLVVFAVLTVVSLIVSLTEGATYISAHDVVMRLIEPGTDVTSQIIWNLRLPRTLTCALTGLNLALSGAILQAVMRNPLADPHIIGISSGAGLAGIILLIVLPAYTFLLPPAAFAGAIGAAVLIYILSWKHGIQPLRIILAGVAVSTFLGAIISGLLIFYSDRVHGALLWLAGGFSACSWHDVSLIVPYTLAGLLLALAGAGSLNILLLGDDTARSLGLPVEVARCLLTRTAALLAASAVSVAGLLGFVGLIVPHTVRLLGGSDHFFLLPGSALLGMAVVTLCDTFGRVIFAPIEIPTGIIMALLGVPFFLYLLRRDLS